ncbi:MAG TPA: hypothetical protein PLD47_12245 [Aggregatilineales bacterium]|nr:hypothetical protein [Anaerolineales bacterium]HRE48487.1 hypothetical protein [Aggregatilineales bacterium]
MTILKTLMRLLTGGGGRPAGGSPRTTFYIKSHSTGHIYPLQINLNNDLSLTDDDKGYFVRKTLVGKPSYDRIEVELTFDRSRVLIDSALKGGVLTDEATYETYRETHPESAT